MCATLKRAVRRGVLFIGCISILFQACSTLQPPDANGPRSNSQPYPLTINEDDDTGGGALAWKNMAPLYGLSAQTEPQFDPLTGTIAALPSNAVAHITLPKVGTGPTPTEEEIRESLRRFIEDWKQLIGAEPAQLSLVERVDEATGLKLARYEQRPFRYPLRGDFGNLSIRFRNNRQVVAVISNCIPHTERLQASLSQLAPKVSAEEAAAHLKGHALVIPDPKGSPQTLTLPAQANVEVRQLVVYALPSSNGNSLDLRLAWEVGIPNGTIKTIYLDAVTDEIIAGS